MCPVCAIGVAAGAGLSRWLGLDDAISGIWIGAFLLILSVWTINRIFKKKNKKPFWTHVASVVFWWLISFLPLYYTGFFEAECQKILFLPKLLFGSLLGLATLLLAAGVDKILRKIRGGEKLFSYQKVIIPILFLIIASLIVWGIC